MGLADAAALEEGVEDTGLGREAARVRERGSLTRGADPAEECDERDVALQRDTRCAFECVRAAKRLDIGEHEPDVGIVLNGLDEVTDAGVDACADPVCVAHAESAAAQLPVDLIAESTALAHDCDGPFGACARRGSLSPPLQALRPPTRTGSQP